MGRGVKSQGIGPMLLEGGVVNLCVRFAHKIYFLLPHVFCLGACNQLGQLVRGAAQGHRLTQLLVDNFSSS